MLDFLLALMPSFIHVRIRMLMGAQIGKGVKISWGVLIRVPNRSLTIGDHVVISPLVFIRAQLFCIGERSRIQSLVKIDVANMSIGNYVTISSYAMFFGGKIEVGDHSWIMYNCYVDATKDVFIGKRVGVGGHSFIFTHGNWQDYIEGGPLGFGPVTLEDNVWIPWRAFIMPNVVIGKNAILGANSLANKSIPPYKVAVGSPAKVIGDVPVVTDANEKRERVQRIINDFREEHPGSRLQVAVDGKMEAPGTADLVFLVNVSLEQFKKSPEWRSGLNVIDHAGGTVYLDHPSGEVESFVVFLTNYGVRLYRHYS